MKTTTTILTSLILALGTPLAFSQNDIDKVKVKIKGENAEEIAEEMLDPEVERAFVTGYAVPVEYRTYFQPVPDRYAARLVAPQDGVIVRYYNNRAYYMDANTYEIVNVYDLMD